MNTKSNGGAWLIVAFFTLFMAVMTFNLIVFPACAVDTMTFYGIDQAGLTTLASVTSVVGLFAGFVFGPIVDRIGARKTIMISMIIGVVLFFIRAFVASYSIVLVLTFAASFFVGVCQVSAGKVLDTWFTKENVGVAFSFQAAGAGIGSAGAFAIGGMLGLHNSLLLIGVAYAALWVFWLVIGKNGPIHPAEAAELPKNSTAMVYKSPCVWLICIGASCAVGSTLLVNSYCINAFVSKGLDPAGASMMGTVINLSLLAGGFVGTFIMNAVKRYNVCTILFFVCEAIGFCGAWFLPLGPQTWILMIFGGVMGGNAIGINSGRTPLIPLTGQFPQSCIGTAAGAHEAIKGVLTFVFPIVVANVFGTNFNAIFIIFGVVCVVGLIAGGLLMPELGPKGKLQQEAAARQE